MNSNLETIKLILEIVLLIISIITMINHRIIKKNYIAKI